MGLSKNNLIAGNYFFETNDRRVMQILNIDDKHITFQCITKAWDEPAIWPIDEWLIQDSYITLDEADKLGYSSIIREHKQKIFNATLKNLLPDEG